jgi:hypothetical protein
VGTLLVLVFSLTGLPSSSTSSQPIEKRAGVADGRNPQRPKAVMLLSPRPAGKVNVRFQWDQVRGATQYVLTGRWTTAPSWTVHSAEYHVTPKVASKWSAEEVSFEMLLPSGSHSWEIVALFGGIETADFDRPALLSFEIR